MDRVGGNAMKHRPTVGVVTVTYNSGEVLDDFLRSISEQTDVDIILYVIDNDSTDNTLAQVESFPAPIRSVVIANDANVGIAIGNNQGIEAAIADRCDWILLLNNDTLFAADAVSELVRVAEENSTDILTPLIEATDPPGTIWYRTGAIWPYKGMKAKHLDMGQPVPFDLVDLREVDYASTCALLIRPTVFDTVGLMDPVYFVYGDDVDFCIRAKRDGFSYFETDVVRVIHKASSLTGEYTAPFAVRWITRNWVVVARRHCTPVQLAVGRVYMAMWLVGRLLARKESLTVSRGRVRAFKEGWGLDLRTPPPRLVQGASAGPGRGTGAATGG
jgi:GT2 family glycosyltransferase